MKRANCYCTTVDLILGYYMRVYLTLGRLYNTPFNTKKALGPESTIILAI